MSNLLLLSSIQEVIKTGKWLWVGKHPVPNISFIDDQDIDNLYRPSAKYGIESMDGIVVMDIFGRDKFDTIALREWFYTLKINGILMIDAPKEASQKLKELITNMYPSNGFVIESMTFYDDRMLCYLRKKQKALADNDVQEAYSFGIITNGKRPEIMEKIIESIRALKIPQYEILICGTYFDRGEKDITYIHFNEHDDKGWITKKKNILCQQAKYENLVIMHDRLVFRPDWYEGMKKFGNAWEAISCVQLYQEKLRTFDWYTQPPGLKAPPIDNIFLRSFLMKGKYRCEMGLHYDDWDPWVILNGGLTILKKSVWQQVTWDEKLFWNQSEDVNLSWRLTKAGVVIRFNPYSICDTLTWRHSVVSNATRNRYELGKTYDQDNRDVIIYNARYYMRQRNAELKWMIKQLIKKVVNKG